MGSLARTIDRALTNIGRSARDMLRDTLRGVEMLEMNDEERVSALATALAQTAMTRHRPHAAPFLGAARVWALEAGAGTVRAVAAPEGPQDEMVDEAAELIVSGAEALLEALDRFRVSPHDRTVAELTLYAQLFGQADIHTMLETFRAVFGALATPGFRPGDRVFVPLSPYLPVGRALDLASAAARGIA